MITNVLLSRNSIFFKWFFFLNRFHLLLEFSLSLRTTICLLSLALVARQKPYASWCETRGDLVTGNRTSADVFVKGEEHAPNSHRHLLNFKSNTFHGGFRTGTQIPVEIKDIEPGTKLLAVKVPLNIFN